MGVEMVTRMLLALLTCSAGCAQKPAKVNTYPATEWEHGWKTKQVTATRYKNQMMGFNIGFKFAPEYRNYVDRVEVMDFLKANGGNVYEGGGYPGAEVFTIFSGVQDREAANVFLPKLLPKLSKLIVEIAAGKIISTPKKEVMVAIKEADTATTITTTGNAATSSGTLSFASLDEDDYYRKEMPLYEAREKKRAELESRALSAKDLAGLAGIAPYEQAPWIGVTRDRSEELQKEATLRWLRQIALQLAEMREEARQK